MSSINNIMYIANRSDVQTAKKNAKRAPNSDLDAMDVLNEVDWVTTIQVYRAQIINKDHSRRKLTNAEWNAQLNRGVFDRDEWLLLHEDAGLLPDSSGMPRVRAMRTDATVKDILDAISNMTISNGPYEIADHVYFEGIYKISDNLYGVSTGS